MNKGIKSVSQLRFSVRLLEKVSTLLGENVSKTVAFLFSPIMFWRKCGLGSKSPNLFGEYRKQQRLCHVYSYIHVCANKIMVATATEERGPSARGRACANSLHRHLSESAKRQRPWRCRAIDATCMASGRWTREKGTS